ncbi:MAG: hypothetical protein AVDCRST_MAG01-01-2326, partial [uncultured Rubrobacteraceae bacterium]
EIHAQLRPSPRRAIGARPVPLRRRGGGVARHLRRRPPVGRRIRRRRNRRSAGRRGGGRLPGRRRRGTRGRRRDAGRVRRGRGGAGRAGVPGDAGGRRLRRGRPRRGRRGPRPRALRHPPAPQHLRRRRGAVRPPGHGRGPRDALGDRPLPGQDRRLPLRGRRLRLRGEWPVGAPGVPRAGEPDRGRPRVLEEPREPGLRPGRARRQEGRRVRRGERGAVQELPGRGDVFGARDRNRHLRPRRGKRGEDLRAAPGPRQVGRGVAGPLREAARGGVV